MRKYAGTLIYLSLFFFLVPFFFYIIHKHTSPYSYSQSISLMNAKVLYDLPYPGILPDHPLYFFKAVRDRVLDITTRDDMKKAELYLLFSDKRFAMADQLVKKGKVKLAVSTLSKGEKYAEKIPELIRNMKKQGSSPESTFLFKVKLSNEKHKEILDDFLTTIPQGQEQSIETIIKMNKNINSDLSSL